MTDIIISNRTKTALKQMAKDSGENYKKLESNLYERVKIYIRSCGFKHEDAETEALQDLGVLLDEE